MIDLSNTTLSVYRKRVYEIYRTLERDTWCELRHFEHLVRKISVLNSKIKSIQKSIKTSEIQKEE